MSHSLQVFPFAWAVREFSLGTTEQRIFPFTIHPGPPPLVLSVQAPPLPLTHSSRPPSASIPGTRPGAPSVPPSRGAPSLALRHPLRHHHCWPQGALLGSPTPQVPPYRPEEQHPWGSQGEVEETCRQLLCVLPPSVFCRAAPGLLGKAVVAGSVLFLPLLFFFSLSFSPLNQITQAHSPFCLTARELV